MFLLGLNYFQAVHGKNIVLLVSSYLCSDHGIFIFNLDTEGYYLSRVWWFMSCGPSVCVLE